MSKQPNESDTIYMLKIELEHYKKLYRDLLVKTQKEKSNEAKRVSGTSV